MAEAEPTSPGTAPAPAVTPAEAEFLKMPKVQRLAAFLLMLGPETAGEILRRFEPKEVELITAEMARLPFISGEVQTLIMKEFMSLAVSAASGVAGGVASTRAILEKALGAVQAEAILSRVAPSAAASTPVWEPIRAMDTQALANLLRHETPQTIALVISHLPNERAAEVLKNLPEPLPARVVERLATLTSAPQDTVEQLAQMLARKLGPAGVARRGVAAAAGLRAAADLLNAMDRDLSRAILNALTEQNAALAEDIRAKMFTFNDLALLDNTSLQKIMREVDLRDLAMALKNASETLKKKLLAGVSRRAAETVNEEINFLGTVKAKEVQAAQSRIIEVVRRLEAEGELDLVEILQSSRNEAMATNA
ncbi:flagellar motor switch protein FliG [Fontisphaera persica]|uniref:flagellar motor switch protein FliG n=1 Tax=Fontisphaera persica TaxID=2974023 RepID=UPI0024BFFAAB|nr:flagellar motor switch protein FliG [Fontisphaera persica]WCJ58229.1 flagellar motor switch protein FliG [Fontisphaera persica]